MTRTEKYTTNLLQDINAGRLEEDTIPAIHYVSHLEYLLKYGDLNDEKVKFYIALCHDYGLDSFRFLLYRSNKISGEWLQTEREKLRKMPGSPITAFTSVRYSPNKEHTFKDKVLYVASAIMGIIMVLALLFFD